MAPPRNPALLLKPGYQVFPASDVPEFQLSQPLTTPPNQVVWSVCFHWASMPVWVNGSPYWKVSLIV